MRSVLNKGYMAVWISKPSYFVLFRHKNRLLATLFIPCTPLGGKVKKYGGKIKKYKAKLKGLGQSYIVSKTAIR